MISHNPAFAKGLHLAAATPSPCRMINSKIASASFFNQPPGGIQQFPRIGGTKVHRFLKMSKCISFWEKTEVPDLRHLLIYRTDDLQVIIIIIARVLMKLAGM